PTGDHPHPCDLNDLLPAGVGMVDEGDEANNTRTLSITVMPLPTPTPVFPGVTPASGSLAQRSPLIEVWETLTRGVGDLLGLMASAFNAAPSRAYAAPLAQVPLLTPTPTVTPTLTAGPSPTPL